MDTVSKQLFERARMSIPGGVNSPARAFRAVGGNPIFIQQAHGARVLGADGTEYMDYVGSWGPAIIGHAHPTVIRAVQEAATRGLSFGAPTKSEVVFAEQIRVRYPSIDRVRCVNSGTEATMSALRVARGFTGRDVIIKFEGCYHGHGDSLLVKAGSGLATQGVPDSAGVPAGIASTTLTLPYNDLEALQRVFEERPTDIAAVIVEPVVGNMGCIPPKEGFLQGIISLCSKYEAVSIFDEVMTGCRLAPGGAQERFRLRPDMTCLGKVVGGGMPLAAYGGKASIMSVVAPEGNVYQAGTLSGNPVAVAAGLATLELLDDMVYDRLEYLGASLEKGLKQSLAERRVPGCVQRVGSMLTLFFHPGPVQSWAEASTADTKRFGKWHAGLLSRGVYWPPSQFEAAFISSAHTESDIEATIKAAWEAMGAIA
jgi:glutamate-1-semialdehyde 2,1-aminomutase